MQTNAGSEVIRFDVLRGIGEAFGVKLGADEVPGGTIGAAEEGVDGARSGADVNAGDGAGRGGVGAVGGIGGVEEGLEPSNVFVAGNCQSLERGCLRFILTVREPVILSGLACHCVRIISVAHWRAKAIIRKLDFELEMSF